MRQDAKAKVNNVPEYAEKRKAWVVRYDDSTKALWFYAAWDDEEKAEQTAEEIENGLVVYNQKGETA